MSGDVDVAKKNVDLDQVEDSLEYAHDQIEKLDRSVHSLPKVDEDGNSECPFAEEMYAQKEDIQAQLNGQLKGLYEKQEAIDAENTRCKNNLVVISAHERRIHRDSVRDQYSQAEVELCARIECLSEMQERVTKTIKDVQAALAEASEKYYPGRCPQNGGASGTPNPGGANDDRELDDLLEIEQER